MEDDDEVVLWNEPAKDGYHLYGPRPRLGLIDNYAVFKNLTDVDLANVSKVKAIGPALGHMIKLIAASPNPNISFQSFRVLMSFAKTLGNDETARLSDEIDSLQSTLNYVRGLAGAKKSLATRQKKLDTNWTAEARAIVKDFKNRHPNCTDRQLAGHIAKKIKGAPGDRAIRKWLKKVGTEPPFKV